MKKNINYENKIEVNQKIKWTFLLFLALISFLIGLMTQNSIYFLIAFALAFCIKKYGYNTLFKEFDDRNKAKIRKIEECIKNND